MRATLLQSPQMQPGPAAKYIHSEGEVDWRAQT